MTISEHFTLEELSFSEAAARLGLNNTPGAIKWAIGVIKDQSLEVLVAIRISSPMTTAMGLQEKKRQTTMP